MTLFETHPMSTGGPKSRCLGTVTAMAHRFKGFGVMAVHPGTPSVHGSCAVNFRKGGGLYLRSPEIRCMQYAKCMKKSNVRGSLGEKWLRNYVISRHGPDFVLFFHFFTGLFNVILHYFFLQAETPPAAQKNVFYESLKWARHRRQFWVFG